MELRVVTSMVGQDYPTTCMNSYTDNNATVSHQRHPTSQSRERSTNALNRTRATPTANKQINTSPTSNQNSPPTRHN